MTLERIVGDVTSADGIEISRPVDTNYACGPAVLLTKHVDVRNGKCWRCLQLEFFRDDTDSYSLRTVTVDDVAPTAEAIIRRAQSLLLEAGMEPERIEAVRFQLPIAEWSAHWVNKEEYRSVQMTIVRDGGTWLLKLSTLRQPVPNAPDGR